MVTLVRVLRLFAKEIMVAFAKRSWVNNFDEFPKNNITVFIRWWIIVVFIPYI